MKKKIHPNYHPKAKVKCACGKTFEVGSTQEKIEIEICSACHPFYTGKKKLVDSTGQVDRFKRILEKTKKMSQDKKTKKEKTTTKTKKVAKVKPVNKVKKGNKTKKVATKKTATKK